jgi:hypothetical protein
MASGSFFTTAASSFFTLVFIADKAARFRACLLRA